MLNTFYRAYLFNLIAIIGLLLKDGLSYDGFHRRLSGVRRRFHCRWPWWWRWWLDACMRELIGHRNVLLLRGVSRLGGVLVELGDGFRGLGCRGEEGLRRGGWGGGWSSSLRFSVIVRLLQSLEVVVLEFRFHATEWASGDLWLLYDHSNAHRLSVECRLLCGLI